MTDKNDDYYGKWCKVSIETWRDFNRLNAEIDNILSKKYIELDNISSFERKRDFAQVLIDSKKINLVGEIQGLIQAQIIIGKMLVGDKID